LPMKMEQIECPETSAYKIQTPGNHPEENIQHTEHGESLKSKMRNLLRVKYPKLKSCPGLPDFQKLYIWMLCSRKYSTLPT
jgi:hypothetical protein